jgi:hypothetical protein
MIDHRLSYADSVPVGVCRRLQGYSLPLLSCHAATIEETANVGYPDGPSPLSSEQAALFLVPHGQWLVMAIRKRLVAEYGHLPANPPGVAARNSSRRRGTGWLTVRAQIRLVHLVGGHASSPVCLATKRQSPEYPPTHVDTERRTVLRPARPSILRMGRSPADPLSAATGISTTAINPRAVSPLTAPLASRSIHDPQFSTSLIALRILRPARL